MMGWWLDQMISQVQLITIVLLAESSIQVMKDQLACCYAWAIMSHSCQMLAIQNTSVHWVNLLISAGAVNQILTCKTNQKLYFLFYYLYSVGQQLVSMRLIHLLLLSLSLKMSLYIQRITHVTKRYFMRQFFLRDQRHLTLRTLDHKCLYFWS